MSPHHAALHRKIRALRRTRDQLEPMVHPGPPDAQKLWEELEKRWSDLENQAKHLTRGTEDTLDDVADIVRESITELRKGYDRLASEIREPRSHSLWGQVRKTVGRLVEGGHRTTECVAGSVEDLTDAAKVRMKQARLERTRFKKRAELGTSDPTPVKPGPAPPPKVPGPIPWIPTEAVPSVSGPTTRER